MASRAAMNRFTESVYDAMRTTELDAEGAIAALLTLACCVNSERPEPLTPIALGALAMGTALRQPRMHVIRRPGVEA
jgi:hypothetical protein